MIARLFQYIIILLMVALPVSVFAAPITSSIAPGLNVVGVTISLATDQGSAFALLTAWQPSGVTAIESYDAGSAMMLRAELDSEGNPAGTDFPLIENLALYVYSSQQNSLSLGESATCAPLNLTAGFNLASHACFPADYLASEFMTSVGLANIASLSRLDLSSGRWQTAAVDEMSLVGADFPLMAGEGYIIHSAAINGWRSPLSASINLSPLTYVTGLNFTYKLTINLSAVAPSGGYPVTLTAAPAGFVSVPASTIVPAGASSVQVTVSATALGTATITATSPGWEGSAVHTVTVKPTQNVNYTPLTSAQVGVQVGPISTAPTSVTPTYTPVTSAQIGVQVGPVFTGPSPNQTRDYGPLTSAPLGIMVETAGAATSQNVTYGPTASQPVGVTVGSTLTAITPISGAIGATGVKVRALGVGLSGASAISFYPATGITIQPASFTIGGDGNPEVIIDIAANAPVTPRTVLVSLASGGYALPTDAGSNQFRVTLPTPEIESLQPLRSMVGQSFTMTINGKNLASASSVNFTPATGITVTNPPTVNGAGTIITSTITIAANAPLGNRTVTVTTPGGTSSSVADTTNSFSVTAATDPGVTHTAFSSGVGVLVETPAVATDQLVNYGPTTSPSLGVTVGSTMISVLPVSGAIGETGLKVRVQGVGLSAASAISFYPATGITIQPASFAIVGGTPEVTIDIAADAPVTPRTVLVSLTSGGYALPTSAGSNQFRVTLPQPELYSVQPLRSMVGQSVTMTVIGKNFASASSVNFTPATGIIVINPPTISPDGTLITSTFTIAADAPLGLRAVTVTTPGGVSSAVVATTNSFTVTAATDPGVTHTSFSAEVGVLVSLPPDVAPPNIDYGPVAASEVGVMVTLPALPTEQDIVYTPIVSAPVGVAVGAVFTGFAPAALEPGSSATFTLSGVGFERVTAITVLPAANLTITDWTPAIDGLSATVIITADAGAVAGIRTLVPLVGSAALPSAAGGGALLQVGYKPVLGAITTTFPVSSVQATLGTSVTLTLNGDHLQWVSKVEVLPADGITIDTAPTWFSDGTGEHVSVTVIIAANAAVGPRLVRLTTPYGHTSATLGVTNTLNIVTLVAVRAPAPLEQSRVVAKKAPEFFGDDALTAIKIIELQGLSGHKLDTALLLSLARMELNFSADSFIGTLKQLAIAAVEQVDASRGPPVG